MATRAVKATLGQELQGGAFAVSAQPAGDPLIDLETLVTAVEDADAAASDAFDSVTIADGATDDALASATAADDQAAVAVAAEVSTTAVEGAVATLEADGATPTEAHVDALRVVWDLLVTDIATLHTEVNDTKTATATAKTDATTSEAAAATALTDAEAAFTLTTAAVALGGSLDDDFGGDFTIFYDDAIVDSGNKVSALARAALHIIRGSGLTFP